MPRPGCAPAVGWPLGDRDSSSQLTKLSQMLQMLWTGGCVLLQMSRLITPTAKHAARCNGCPVSVSGYTCSCSVAEPRLGLGRGGVIPTPSAILLTKRLDVSCVVCLNVNNHAQKKYCTRYTLTKISHGDPMVNHDIP